MTESERNEHQLDLAKRMALGKVVTPCVSIRQSAGQVEIASTCEFLDVKKGCQKNSGFRLAPGKAVNCPDGKGTIIIHTENITELLPNQNLTLLTTGTSDYAREIACMKVDSNLSEHADERTMLFM
ncbi:MAG: hypothetical protein Q7T54_03685 [Candidatus Levybacteria bacterium]|nr:hypothetical protein [Candidatus Levybacteria bacterium]